MAPNSASGTAIRSIGAGGVTSQKNSDAASHIETAGALVLNESRVTVRDSRGRRRDITRPSAPASNAPAGGPYRSAAAIVNVSESETLNGAPGMRTVAHPVVSVNSARIAHVGGNGLTTSCTPDAASTIAPVVTTAARYTGRTHSKLNRGSTAGRDPITSSGQLFGG